MIAEQAKQRDHPSIAFQYQHRRATAIGWRRWNDYRDVAFEVLRRPPVNTSAVAQSDGDRLLGRLRVTRRLQPGRRLRSTAARINGQRAGHGFLVAAVDMPDADALDAPRIRTDRQRIRVDAVNESHVGDGPDARAHVALEKGAAGEQRLDARATRVITAVIEPAHVLDVDLECASPCELVGEPWEQGFQHLATGGEQGMRMTALGHALAVDSVAGEDVALEHDDLVKAVGQDSRREQAGHAAADNARARPSHLSAIR